MKSLFLLSAVGLFAVAGCTAESVESADLADDVSVDSSEDALSRKTRITPGSFDLSTDMNPELDPFCNIHGTIELKNAPAAKATLRTVVSGRCRIAVNPNERTFNVRLESESCGSKTYVGTRGRGSKKSSIRITDHRTRLCMDLPSNLLLTVEETVPGSQGATTTTEFAIDTAVPVPPAPTFCADGRIVSEPAFVDSADGKQCSIPNLHCVTKSMSACPQLSPLPPSFCADGTVVRGPSRFIASVDGKECEMPSVHCVTKDAFACPMLSPMHPDFCKDGDLVSGEKSFIDSSDGKECQMPSVHCLTKDTLACPQL